MKAELMISRAGSIWKKMAREISERDLNYELEIQKKVLDVFHIGDWYYYVFNIKNACFDFMSDEITKVLGYEKDEVSVPMIINSIHPDDQPWFLNFENKVGEFFATLTKDQIPNYKISYDYRIRKKNGEYIRILQQTITLQFDEEGSLLRSLGIHTNIQILKPKGAPTISFIGLNGEPSFYNVDVKNLFVPSENFLSKREHEVLIQILKGYNSQKVGEVLNISKQTVDTHRKNLLRKAGVVNTAELISVAIEKGWI